VTSRCVAALMEIMNVSTKKGDLCSTNVQFLILHSFHQLPKAGASHAWPDPKALLSSPALSSTSFPLRILLFNPLLILSVSLRLLRVSVCYILNAVASGIASSNCALHWDAPALSEGRLAGFLSDAFDPTAIAGVVGGVLGVGLSVWLAVVGAGEGRVRS